MGYIGSSKELIFFTCSFLARRWGRERLALERPQAADFPDPDISWVTVDEVIYSSSTPWPNVSTNGTAIHRIDLRHSGNDPLNWTALQPTLAEDNNPPAKTGTLIFGR